MPKRDRTVFETEVPMWKARDLIYRMGGVGGMTEELMKAGFRPPPADTVQGWVSRNSIPGAWSPAVFGLAMKMGIISNPLDARIKDRRL